MKVIPSRALWVASTTILLGCSSPARPPQLNKEGKDLVQKPTAESQRLDELEEQYKEQSKRINEFLDAMAEKDSMISTNQQIIDSKDKEIQDLKNMDAEEDKLSEDEKKALKDQVDALESEKKNLSESNKKLEEEKKKLEAQAKSVNNVKPTGTASNSSAAPYYFVRFGNMCLDVANSSVAENARIMGLTCRTPGLNQQFAYLPGQNYFYLRSRISNKCIATLGSAVGSAIVQKTCTNTTDKVWESINVGGRVKFRNRWSGNCMAYDTANNMVLTNCNSQFALTFTWIANGNNSALPKF
ncbi:ricin-type beta-trefoil lectin domain protein [Oligoflexus tunisiensis]|uniref:ricin-type beta-trefoil lectin domain protein n=1 Tax=Oligoflexus tunisiensis TaxID=708132 RepID=UPI00114D02AE|nr:ricin-type beta-trefoil lectin domain protein [Oligoflexus tunisiensis]